MSFYDVDYYEWPAKQAQLLREGRFDEADMEAIAEGLDEISNSTRKELRSHLRVLLTHLLKYQFQPERRTPSWTNTIRTQRANILDDLDDSPSLQSDLPQQIDKAYVRAVRLAAGETGFPGARFPRQCPYTLDQILDFDYLPDGSQEPA